MKTKTTILLVIICLTITPPGKGQETNRPALSQEISRLAQDSYHLSRTNALERFSAFHAAHPWATIHADDILDYASFTYDYAHLLMNLKMYDQSILVLDEIPTNTLSPSTRKEILMTKSMALRGAARQSMSPERDRLWEKAQVVFQEAEAITNAADQEYLDAK